MKRLLDMSAAAIVLLASTRAPAVQEKSVPTLEEIANSTYQGIYDEPVKLDYGIYEGDPFVPGGAARPRVELVKDFLLTGDLDSDGNEEVVVFLSESSGGSGTLLYLAVVGRRDGEVVNLGTALVGDRAQIRAARLEEERIELEVIQAGPEDAACCPSQKAIRTWALKKTELDEVSSKITGTLSLSDLGGVEWILTHLDWDEEAPAEPEVTFVFEGTRVSGMGGCNRYFAQIQSGTLPGELSIGPVGSTQRACPHEIMELETRYLKALGSAIKYSFLVGRLVLATQDTGGPGVLIFESREPE